MTKEIVFITDNWNKESTYSLSRKDIEGNTQKVAFEIVAELKKISPNVTLYTNPKDFSDDVSQHLNSVVLNTYYGIAAPNSKSLIPSICEINNICFVGADSYVQMLCNDKYLSKKYISDFGLRTPNGILIRNNSKAELKLLHSLKLPLVIKPNFGGGSNGISCKNLVYNYTQAQNLVCQLLEYQKLSVLAEEYIPGYEVEYVLFGNNRKVFIESEIGIQVDGVDYFQKQIWGYEAKKAGLHQNKLSPTEHISPTEREKIRALFCSFSKAEIMRIDCRIYNQHVYVLELSPDCYLGPTGGVAKAFEYNNINYTQMFSELIRNAIDNKC